MRSITHIVVHTSASAVGGAPYDASSAQIDGWHRARGWAGIGYHWVVRMTGAVEPGRPESAVGAGVEGFNARSVHVCLSGHGDVAPPTPVQWAAAVRLVADIARRHGLAAAIAANPSRVLGHREVWFLRLVPKPIRKTCPGLKVDMAAFRRAVLAELGRG